MIFRGRYRYSFGAYRPFMTAYVLAVDGRWTKHTFPLDTGADVTFLPYRDVKVLGIELSGVEVKDDVGGVGGYGGRDVLNHFVCIFDRAKDEVLLLDAPDSYQVVSA